MNAQTGRYWVAGWKGEQRPFLIARHPGSSRCARKALKFQDDGTTPQVGGFPLCPDCGVRLCSPRIIRAIHSDTVKCGPKCREAFGLSDCRCSCDGANHASGWTADQLLAAGA